MSGPGNPIWPESLKVRGGILPLGRDASGKLVLAWPEAVRETVNAGYNALMAPQIALTGREARGPVAPKDFNPFTSGLGTGLLMAGSGFGLSPLVERAPGFAFGSFKGYHGTPHTFEPVEHNPFGEFRDAAIGTGEGAQAYGYGHYVAGAKKTAEQYKDQLSNWIVQYDGKPVEPDHSFNIHTAAQKSRDPIATAASEFVHSNWSIPHAIGSVQGRIAHAEEKLDSYYNLESPTKADHEAAKNWRAALKHLEQVEDVLRSGKDKFQKKSAGNLLELQIRPDEHELLDWDLPFSQQHPSIQEKLKPLIEQSVAKQQAAREARLAKGTRFSLSQGHVPLSPDEIAKLRIPIDYSQEIGQHLYERVGQYLPDGTIAKNYSEAHPAASAALAAAGIPGIKYLDAMSRPIQQKGAPKVNPPPPTYNYVIFNPKDIRIIGRNGETLRMEPVDHDPFKSTTKK